MNSRNPENLVEYLSMMEDPHLADMISSFKAIDLADVWSHFSDENQLRIFRLADKEMKSDLMSELSPQNQETLLEALSEQSTRILLQEMEPDDIVDLIQDIKPEIRKAVWDNLSESARTETEFLLRFDQDDAAGLMTPRYAAVQAEVTVQQAINFIRNKIDESETIYYIYVIDQLKRLMGVVSLRQLLGAPDTSKVGEIMIKDMVFVYEDTDQEETAEVLEDHDLLAIPVIDHYHRLLGIVTFDDIIDVIREEQTEDIYRMGAMGGNTRSYLDTSVWGLVWKRLPWLIFLLLAGTITTNVLSHYQPLMTTAVFLGLFITVITQTGGNSGTQSSTLMIRGLATGELEFRDIGKVMLKEIFVGLLIGVTTGVIILIRSALLPPGIAWIESAIVALSLTSVVIFATMTGALIPMIIHRLGFDPTVAAGPLMSTLIDVCGLTIYFEVSRIFLHL